MLVLVVPRSNTGEISPFLLGRRREMFYSVFQSILIKNGNGFCMVTVIVLNGRIKFALLDNYAGMAVNKYLLIKF